MQQGRRALERGLLVALIALLHLAPPATRAQSNPGTDPAADSALAAILGPAADRLERLTTLAFSGNRDAQFRLGQLYAQGDGVPIDDEEAVAWWRKAAEQGHAQAQNELGAALTDGRGVDPDPKQAAEWYRKSAEQGLSVAQANLGMLYAEGKGVRRNLSEAVRWFQLAAEQGLGWAQYFLGDAFVSGRGVRPDNRKAAEWYRKAAEQDYAEAQYAYGALVRRFRGSVAVRDDFSREAHPEYWLARAAQSGHAAAAQYLARMAGPSGRRTLAAGVAIMAQPDTGSAVLRILDAREPCVELLHPDGVNRRREWVPVYLEREHTMGFVRQEDLRRR